MVAFGIQGIASEKPVRAPLKKNEKVKDVNITKLFPLDVPANKAMHYARDRLFQRNVDIEVVSLGRDGTFYGYLYCSDKPFGDDLLRGGFAKLHSSSYFLDRDTYNRWQNLELEAKKGRECIWEEWDEEAEKAALEKKKAERLEQKEQQKNAKAAQKNFQIVVTEIMTGSRFCYQIVNDESKALEEMMEAFQKQDFDSQEPYSPKEKRELVAGRFTLDNHWYRAEVIRIIKPKSEKKKKETSENEEEPETQPVGYEVVYIDYGNTEIIHSDRIRTLQPDFNEKTLPRQSHKAKLAFVKSPELNQDFGQDAAVRLKELVWNKKLLATLVGQEGRGHDEISHLLLGDPDTEQLINHIFVSEGLARVEKRRVDKDNTVWKELQKEESQARHSRLNIWQYGDFPDSDEERLERNLLK
jgi:staphylococcal nuclease domain-containing protein 1